MAGVEMFERELRLAIGDLRPEVVTRELALFARQSLAAMQATGEASQTYDRYVNGRLGAPEESVQLPGPILYVFSNWRLVIETALVELQKRVPRKSGMYAASFIVVVGGRVVTSFDAIPAESQVVILNTRPYTRKMEVGANGRARPNGPGKKHFENTKTALNSRFRGAFSVTTTFVRASNGLHPEIPYILKGSAPDRAAAQSRRSSAFRAGRSVLARRKDTDAGQPLTYPALVIDPI